MPVDLHTHSAFSDGSDSPARLVELAFDVGLDAIALTDHDTLEGVGEAEAAATSHGIELVPGVELSLGWTGGTMHMVVLFLAPGPGPLQDRLAGLRASRADRNARIVERLRSLGCNLTLDEVLEGAGEGVVGRPHFAAVMVRKGFVSSTGQAFDEYLANGAPAYVDRDRLDVEEAIRLARRSGAAPVIAHPHTLGLATDNELEDAFRPLAEIGLVGVESYYPEYDPTRRKELAALARRVGLIPSGGSDYHGSFKVGLELGTGRGDLHVGSEVVDELKAALG